MKKFKSSAGPFGTTRQQTTTQVNKKDIRNDPLRSLLAAERGAMPGVGGKSRSYLMNNISWYVGSGQR